MLLRAVKGEAAAVSGAVKPAEATLVVAINYCGSSVCCDCGLLCYWLPRRIVKE